MIFSLTMNRIKKHMSLSKSPKCTLHSDKKTGGLVFKCSVRFKAAWKETADGEIKEGYASGITQERFKQKCAEKGYIFVSAGDYEPNI